MSATETWNEELEKELTFECLGEPERPITEELCSNVGAKYAAVFIKAEDMVKAALEVKKDILGLVHNVDFVGVSAETAKNVLDFYQHQLDNL